MKPILQLYALCLDKLPGYDKCDEYWDDVDKALSEKPMYQNELRRKNRISNLKLLMVKELLFDRFINILCEPKVPKIRKSSKSIKNSAKSTSVAINAIVDTTDNDKDSNSDINDINDTSLHKLNLDATIKITKKVKTGTIESTAYIQNDKKKKIWVDNNENCKDKDYEIITLIKKIINFNSNNIYYITLNNKGFKDEYNRAHHLYNELVKEKRIYMDDTIDNIMKKIMDNHDIGKLKDISNIYKYYDIILLNSKFMFV
jgi:hypothetical protein